MTTTEILAILRLANNGYTFFVNMTPAQRTAANAAVAAGLAKITIDPAANGSRNQTYYTVK